MRVVQFICCYPSLTVPFTLLSDVADHHIDLPASKGNEKGSSIFSDKYFLGKVCKESQCHFTGEASEGFVSNNKPSADESSFMGSSGRSENSCGISSEVSCYSQYSPLPVGFGFYLPLDH